MTTQQEEQWKERDFERFRQSERLITHRPKEPPPPGAVAKVNEDAKEIFGEVGKPLVDNSNLVD